MALVACFVILCLVVAALLCWGIHLARALQLVRAKADIYLADIDELEERLTKANRQLVSRVQERDAALMKAYGRREVTPAELFEEDTRTMPPTTNRRLMGLEDETTAAEPSMALQLRQAESSPIGVLVGPC